MESTKTVRPQNITIDITVKPDGVMMFSENDTPKAPISWLEASKRECIKQLKVSPNYGKKWILSHNDTILHILEEPFNYMRLGKLSLCDLGVPLKVIYTVSMVIDHKGRCLKNRYGNPFRDLTSD